MKPLRIFRHIACEGPGYLGDFLQQRNLPYEVVCIDEGVPVPRSLNEVSGLIFMGGSMSVNDPLQWITDELDLIQDAVKQQLPVLGVCLGAQLISKALGGTVSKGPGMEIGWHPVHKLNQPGQNGWIKDLPERFTPFHWHGDTFTLPSGVTPLFASECYENQAFAIDNTLALQFHLEMTSDMVKEWVTLYGSDLHSDFACTQNAEAILNDLDHKVQALNQHAASLCQKWIDHFI